MKRDIKMDMDGGKFKYRVSGALVVDGKLLVVQIMNNGFYCLPGGHIELGEFSNIAVDREFEEEVNTPVTVKCPMAMVESIFERKDGAKVHEVGMTYILEATGDLQISSEDYETVEDDDGVPKKLEFKWVKLEEIDSVDFRPAILKEQLKNKDFTFKHYTTD